MKPSDLRARQQMESMWGRKLRSAMKRIPKSLLLVTLSITDPLIVYKYSIATRHLVKDIDLHLLILNWRPRVLNYKLMESNSFWKAIQSASDFTSRKSFKSSANIRNLYLGAAFAIPLTNNEKSRRAQVTTLGNTRRNRDSSRFKPKHFNPLHTIEQV